MGNIFLDVTVCRILSGTCCSVPKIDTMKRTHHPTNKGWRCFDCLKLSFDIWSSENQVNERNYFSIFLSCSDWRQLAPKVHWSRGSCPLSFVRAESLAWRFSLEVIDDSLEHILKPLARNMVDAANVWIPDIELSLAFNQPANFCHRNASIILTTCYIWNVSL